MNLQELNRLEKTVPLRNTATALRGNGSSSALVPANSPMPAPVFHPGASSAMVPYGSIDNRVDPRYLQWLALGQPTGAPRTHDEHIPIGSGTFIFKQVLFRTCTLAL